MVCFWTCFPKKTYCPLPQKPVLCSPDPNPPSPLRISPIWHWMWNSCGCTDRGFRQQVVLHTTKLQFGSRQRKIWNSDSGLLSTWIKFLRGHPLRNVDINKLNCSIYILYYLRIIYHPFPEITGISATSFNILGESEESI